MRTNFLKPVVIGVLICGTVTAAGLELVQPVGVPAAVEAAEQATGGRAIEAEYDDDAGGVYEVDVLRGDAIRRVIVDARSGSIVQQKQRRAETLWRRWSDREALESARTGRPLGELLRSVESVTSGKVVDVELTTSRGRVFYNVDAVTAQGPRSLIVDPVSGTALDTVDD